MHFHRGPTLALPVINVFEKKSVTRLARPLMRLRLWLSAAARLPLIPSLFIIGRIAYLLHPHWVIYRVSISPLARFYHFWELGSPFHFPIGSLSSKTFFIFLSLFARFSFSALD